MNNLWVQKATSIVKIVQKLLKREAFSLVGEHLKKRNSETTQKDVV